MARTSSVRLSVATRQISDKLWGSTDKLKSFVRHQERLEVNFWVACPNGYVQGLDEIQFLLDLF